MWGLPFFCTVDGAYFPALVQASEERIILQDTGADYDISGMPNLGLWQESLLLNRPFGLFVSWSVFLFHVCIWVQLVRIHETFPIDVTRPEWPLNSFLSWFCKKIIGNVHLGNRELFLSKIVRLIVLKWVLSSGMLHACILRLRPCVTKCFCTLVIH